MGRRQSSGPAVERRASIRRGSRRRTPSPAAVPVVCRSATGPSGLSRGPSGLGSVRAIGRSGPIGTGSGSGPGRRRPSWCADFDDDRDNVPVGPAHGHQGAVARGDAGPTHAGRPRVVRHLEHHGRTERGQVGRQARPVTCRHDTGKRQCGCGQDQEGRDRPCHEDSRRTAVPGPAHDGTPTETGRRLRSTDGPHGTPASTGPTACARRYQPGTSRPAPPARTETTTRTSAPPRSTRTSAPRGAARRASLLDSAALSPRAADRAAALAASTQRTWSIPAESAETQQARTRTTAGMATASSAVTIPRSCRPAVTRRDRARSARCRSALSGPRRSGPPRAARGRTCRPP